MSTPVLDRPGAGGADRSGLGPSRGWRPALRMAGRDLRRHRGRTAAALVMVFLPVLVACGVAVAWATMNVSDSELQQARAGAGDVVLTWQGWTSDATSPPQQQRVEAVLGTPVLQVDRGYTRVSTPELAIGAGSLVVDFTDPLSEGLVEVLDGRLPAGPSEAAVNPGLAAGLGVTVGDTVLVEDDERSVVGVGVLPGENPGAATVFSTPVGEAPPAGDQVTERYFVAGDEAFEQGEGDLAGLGLRLWFDGGPGTPSERGVTGGGTLLVAVAVALAAMEIALLAGPAFAVGVRRQQRTLALVAATGGDSRALRRIVLAQAVLVGVAASLAAAVVGVVTTAAALELLRYRVPATIGPLDVPWAAVVGFVVVGSVAALASALVPALAAVRSTVVGGLSPRAARAEVPRRRPLAGLGLLLLGTVALWLSVTALRSPGLGALDVSAPSVGALAVLLMAVGMVLVVPFPVALAAGATSRLPLGARLAGRETTRAGARSVAAIAAVAGATASLVAVSCLTAALTEEARQRYVPSTAAGVSSVLSGDVLADRDRVAQARPDWRTGLFGNGGDRAVLDVQSEYWLPTPGCEDLASGLRVPCRTAWRPSDVDRYSRDSVVVDATGARLAGYPLDQAQLDVLAAGGVLVADSARAAPPTDGTLELRESVYSYEPDGSLADLRTGSVQVPAATFRPEPMPSQGSGSGQAVLLVSPAAADQLTGWFPTDLLVAPDGVEQMTADESLAAGDELRELLGSSVTDAFGLTQPTTVRTEVGFRSPFRVAELLLLAVAGVVVLGATFTATALALADARTDRGVLAALGASPRTQRVMAGSTAALLALTGAVIGSTVGLVPGVMGGSAILERGVGIQGVAHGALGLVPWGAVGVGVLVLPVVAGLVVGLSAQGPPPTELRPRGVGG